MMRVTFKNNDIDFVKTQDGCYRVIKNDNYICQEGGADVFGLQLIHRLVKVSLRDVNLIELTCEVVV